MTAGFRFTIRDLLWLMVVVGLAMACLYERRIINMREADVAEREASIAQREESLKADVKWLTRGQKDADIERKFIPPQTLEYYPPDANDL